MNWISKKENIFLILVILLFLVTRLYKISSVPPSVYWDEASIGYNAYSVLITGRDEWGEFLPVHFRAFGEFKLPIYIYATVPFVKYLGLNSLAVRLPSVVFSLGIVSLTYLLVLQISKSRLMASFSAFYISVTPWLFIFSRSGYEATTGLMFYLLGLYLLIKFHNKGNYLILATISFIISIYGYNSFRIISPVTLSVYILWLVRSNRNLLKNIILPILLSVVIFIISIIPIARLYIYDTGSLRAQAVGLEGTAQQKTLQFIKNYVTNLNFGYLFTDGDLNLRSQVSGFGQLYIISFPLLILGIFYLFKNKRMFTLILSGLLLSIFPAALTRENPHALRSILAIFFYTLICSYGMYYLVEKYQKQKNLIYYGIVLVFIIYFIGFLQNFFVQYPIISSKDWQWEYKRVFEEAIKYPDKQIFISDNYGQPYIFYLFYNNIDPLEFWKLVEYNPPGRWGISLVSKIGKFNFIEDIDSNLPKNSLVFSSVPVSNLNSRWISEIINPNGEKMFDVYEY